MRKRFLCLIVIMAVLTAGAWAGTTDVPRILLAGDSWGAFMQLLRSIDATRVGSGYDWTGIGQRGHRTTTVGARAFPENDPEEWRSYVVEELNDYPTIDIVHLSIGGNDFVLDSGWNPSMTSTTVTNRINAIVAKVSETIDTILAIRPNVRVALCGYDFGNHSVNGMTVRQMNDIMVQFEQARKDMVLAKGSRVFYVHNLGLMQYYYGIPLASPAIAPMTVDLPGGYAQNYIPFPGGNPDYNSPLEALMDDDMHLTLEGYDYIAQRCYAEVYNTWLAWPAVYEILPVSGKDSSQTFRVTFSKPVTGVDESDFTVSNGTVTGVSGSDAVYTVTTSSSDSAATLTVVDDDTIVDGDARPLGGAGTGNGAFSYDGALQYADPPLASADDFDGAMWSLSRAFTAVSWMLSGQQFDPDHCDANGGSIEVNPPSINGNGVLDSAELAIVYECLHNETLNLSATGGITHAQVVAAYEHNHAQILADLGGVDGRALLSVPGMDVMMAGFMTLGDSGSTLIPVLLMTAVSEYIQFPGVTIPAVTSYNCTLARFLGTNGDADGDGFTNREEYNEFYSAGGREMYVKAALDPTITPPSCANSGGTTLDAGQEFCVGIQGEINVEGGFQWYHNDVAMSDNNRVTGANTRDLHFSALAATDAGEYECVYDNGSKRFGPITVTVISHTPVAGLGGLVALGAAITALATRRLRRRDR